MKKYIENKPLRECKTCKLISHNTNNMLREIENNIRNVNKSLNLISKIRNYPGWNHDFLEKTNKLKAQILNFGNFDIEEIQANISELINISNKRHGNFDHLNPGYCFDCGNFYLGEE